MTIMLIKNANSHTPEWVLFSLTWANLQWAIVHNYILYKLVLGVLLRHLLPTHYHFNLPDFSMNLMTDLKKNKNSGSRLKTDCSFYVMFVNWSFYIRKDFILVRRIWKIPFHSKDSFRVIILVPVMWLNQNGITLSRDYS